MRPLNFVFALLAALLSICSLSSVTVAQSQMRVLFTFAPDPDCGGLADTPLIADPHGSLYGGTDRGGPGGQGCIFELSPSANGWDETVLHGFSGTDGNGPGGAVIFDKHGNLYGTTVSGGAYDAGIVFELSPSGSGDWTQTILHNFGSVGDGTAPESNLVFDNLGNLYGTTNGGGTAGNGGTVFELSPRLEGWIETLLYSFPGSINGPDGDGPKGGVVMDREGRFYGNTQWRGAYGDGAVFELVPRNGTYTEEIIHSFNGVDGIQPISGLTMDKNGKIYGTTSIGGDPDGYGTIFELTKGTNGVWKEKTLHEMNGNDGASPIGPVVFDAAGNLYAAAQFGAINAMGSVFKLTPTQTGYWKETMLHRFDFKFPDGVDGEQPYAGVILNRGKVFGTTSSGGVNDSGIVFEITP